MTVNSFSRNNIQIQFEEFKYNTIKGDIIVKDRDIQVEVYLSDGSKVLGRVRNAEVIRY
jgi:hypothetical protein